jgi:hypothetical protein
MMMMMMLIHYIMMIMMMMVVMKMMVVVMMMMMTDVNEISYIHSLIHSFLPAGGLLQDWHTDARGFCTETLLHTHTDAFRHRSL